MKRRTPKPEVDAARLSRILAQAEAHGGIKQMAFEWLDRHATPRPPVGGSWEQLEFPWAHA